MLTKVLSNIKISQFKNLFLRSSYYLPFLKNARYIGSMFVIRAIMRDKEKTDERTSVVTSHSKNC